MSQSSPPSMWKTKPWWCQPWSIVLTGLMVPSGIWWLTQRWWLVLPVVVFVLLWWFVFLYAVPAEYAALGSQSQDAPTDSAQSRQ
ncbi:MAG: DUF6737 family protein [Elainellaceae cyanobacterium]